MIFPDQVVDLSPLRALPELRLLQCGSRQNTFEPLDLSALNGMKIRSLKCFGRLLDFSAVKGLPLSELVTVGGLADLRPLSGMRLEKLTVAGNWDLKSLEPLKGMPLTCLACGNCQIADLSPLKGMPLELLYCDHTLINDLSPLAGMKLKKLSFTPNPELKGMPAIRQMNSLVEIGTAEDKLMPSNEFWKKYDAGEFAK
jgi:hypothetical protein